MIGSRTPVIATWYVDDKDHGNEHYLSLVDAAVAAGVASVEVYRAIRDGKPIGNRYYDYDIFLSDLEESI